MERAKSRDPLLVSAVGAYLDRYAHRAGITHFSAKGTYLDTSIEDFHAPEFNQRGIEEASNYLVSGSAYWAVNDFVAVNIGGIAGQREYAKDEFAEGSFISLGWDYLQADIGYRSHWLGPFQESDMILSTQATAMPGITLSNVQPLPWFGIQYELFMQQMSESDLVRSRDQSQRLTGNPLLAGVHLSFAPAEGFAIGFNRLLQFGGADRDDSFSGLYNAFFNVKESENSGISGNDFGNQVSSITTRYTFAGEFPISVYMEYAGEDTSNSSGVHLGNTSLMLGVHIPKLTKNLDLTWETGEWQNGWYANGNYGDGLTHYDSIIGHWGASQRVPSQGASAQTIKLIWDILPGKSLTMKYNSVDNVHLSGEFDQQTEVLDIEYSQGMGDFIVGLQLKSGTAFTHGAFENTTESFNRISGFIRW